jgi:hypothetical protein
VENTWRFTINGSQGKGMEHEIKIFFYSNDVLDMQVYVESYRKKNPFLC